MFALTEAQFNCVSRTNDEMSFLNLIPTIKKPCILQTQNSLFPAVTDPA
jgi:hypothetical protein